ncbi:MAG: hypothetical protein VX407_01150, partial [Verrucomicrobiota bacterium]|nr:hypothetical protein [Verrucomicrobiota bacterium]
NTVGVTIEPEWSNDLAKWTTDFVRICVMTPSDNGCDKYEYYIIELSNKSKLPDFLRLKAALR